MVDLPQHQDPCIRTDLGAPEIDTNAAVEARDNTTVFRFTRLVHANASLECRVFAIISGTWKYFEDFSQHFSRIIRDKVRDLAPLRSVHWMSKVCLRVLGMQMRRFVEYGRIGGKKWTPEFGQGDN
jgi:hypothetical protein